MTFSVSAANVEKLTGFAKLRRTPARIAVAIASPGEGGHGNAEHLGA
jgi:hypothetical protein